jgi:hypothetical protein
LASCFDSLKICALRVTALDNVGNVAPGPNNAVATARETQLQFTGDVDQGKDLFYRNGCDKPLAAYKSQALLKRFTLQLDLFGIEPAVQSLMLGATIEDDDAGAPIGFEYNIQTCPSDPTPPLVAVEAWSFAWDCDAQNGTTPYFYWLWPMTQWSADQADSLQADFVQPKLTGFSRRNPLWGHGPYGGIAKGAGATTYLNGGAPGVILTKTAPPSAVCGFITVTPGS